MAQRLAAPGILEVEKERLKQLKVFLLDTAQSGKVPLLPKQKNEVFFLLWGRVKLMESGHKWLQGCYVKTRENNIKY